jgi:Cu/Ag efflux protein CusF
MSVHALMIQSDTLRPSHSAASITKLCANHLRVFPEGTNPAITTHPATGETAMKIAKIILAGTTALTTISSAAFARQALTGTVAQVDRINRTVAIRQTQSGTIGANTGGAAEEFKAQDGLSLDTLHAGDKVSFSATETGLIKTITKLQNQ